MQQQDIFDLIIRDLQERKSAFLDFQNKEKPILIHKEVIDLGKPIDKDDPRLINFSFRSVYVEEATDPSCVIYLRPNTKEALQPDLKFTLKDTWPIDTPVTKAYLHWELQPGKKMTLVFLPNSEFRSGSQLSVNAGGLAINEGAQFTVTNPALIAGINLIDNTDFNRKVLSIQNTTGTSLWFGDSTVSNAGATRGREVVAGDTFVWKNTAPLYCYSVAGAVTVNVIKEV